MKLQWDPEELQLRPLWHSLHIQQDLEFDYYEMTQYAEDRTLQKWQLHTYEFQAANEALGVPDFRELHTRTNPNGGVDP